MSVYAAFIMTGGTITGNKVTGSTWEHMGGGVYGFYKGTFEMSGGTIESNTAQNGGGVSMYDGCTFKMTGGTIKSNSAQNGADGVFAYNGGNFEMTDGYMLNAVLKSGANSSVSVSGGKFSQAAFDSVNTILSEQDMQLIQTSPAETDGSFSAAAAGTAHTHADGAEFATALSTTGGALAEGKYYLAGDVILTTDLTISGEVTLCLNGHKLTGTRQGSVITVNSGAAFTLCDCSTEANNVIGGVTYTTGVVTGGYALGNGGGGVYVNGGTFTMSGGTIAKNVAVSSGGGVYVDGGTFIMSGTAAIKDNVVDRLGDVGKGVHVAYGTFTMEGGKISDGICLSHKGEATINGGEINADTAVAIADAEGVVLKLVGGSITGETAGIAIESGAADVQIGGGAVKGMMGVYVKDAEGATLAVSEGGSVDGTLAGIFLENGAIEVTVSGGTVTGVRAGVLADSSAADIAVSGGKISSLHVNSGAVSVSGGYFAVAPEVDGYTAVETAEGGEGYGYTLYENGDTSAYAAADVSAVYGEAYTYSVTNPNGVEVTYSQTPPAAAGSYTVTATFAACRDDANRTYYPETEVRFTVTVAKAAGTNAPEYEKPTGLSVCVGRTLGDIVLPENWAWADGAASVGDTAGEKTFVAVFTPDDTDNYNAEEVALTVTVAPHIEVVDPAKEPTCTESGLTEGKHCSVCGVVLEKQETIAALNHDYTDVTPVWNWEGLTSATASFACAREGCEHVEVVTAVITNEVTTASTCKTEGVRTYTATVTFGEKTFTDSKTEAIAKAAHTPETIPGKAATCTETGLTEGSKCSVCGEMLKEQETIPASGHDFGDWTVTKEAGIGSEGEETRICTRCGETETRTIPAKEFPVWAIVLICVGFTAIVSGIIAVVIVIRKRK